MIQSGWDVSEALKQTARWYERYFKKPESMRELSLEQISSYENTLAGTTNLKMTMARIIAFISIGRDFSYKRPFGALQKATFENVE